MAKLKLKGAEQKVNPAVKKGGSGFLQTTGQGDTTSSIAVAASQDPKPQQQTATPTATPEPSTTAQTLTEAFANTDPTTQAQATTKEEVEAQDARTRLWQSLSNSYQQQIDKSEKDYEQAKLSTEKQMLNKGMQRSSTALALQAQLEDRKANATRDILSSQIADYQNRLGELEQREQQQANWQAEFDANQAAQQWSQNFQQQQFEYQQQSNQQQIAMNYILRMLETNDKPSDALLKQAGITRKDYEQMKTAAKKNKSSGGGRRSTAPTTTPPGTQSPGTSDTSLENQAQSGNGTTGNIPFNPQLPSIVEQKKKEEEEKKKKQGLPKIQQGTVKPTIRIP